MKQQQAPSLPAAAITCLNGLKHGGASQTLFIPGENPQDFDTLLAELFETHQPATTADAAVVTDSALARWYLWRRQRVYNKRECEIYSQNPNPDSLSSSQLRELVLFDRYRTQAERAFKRAFTNLHNLQKSVFAESKWREQLELQKARFDLQRQRFELQRGRFERQTEKKTAVAAKSTKIKNDPAIAVEKPADGSPAYTDPLVFVPPSEKQRQTFIEKEELAIAAA
jgi:hypothetical protein